jgi:hypothetical protein
MDRRMDQLLYSPQIPFHYAPLDKHATGNTPTIPRATTGDKRFYLNRSK